MVCAGEAFSRDVPAEAGHAEGAFGEGPRAEGTAWEGGQFPEGDAKAAHHGLAMARKAELRRDGRELADGLEVLPVVVVGEPHGAGEFAAMADNEVADEGCAEPVDDKAAGAWSVARDGNGRDAGQDLGLLVDREIDRDVGAVGLLEPASEEACDVGPADGGVEERLAIADEAIAAADVQPGPGGGADSRGGAGVITVPVDGREAAPVGADLGEDGGGARCEAGIDECELSVVSFDEVDVGAAGAVEPPESWCEQVGQSGYPLRG